MMGGVALGDAFTLGAAHGEPVIRAATGDDQRIDPEDVQHLSQICPLECGVIGFGNELLRRASLQTRVQSELGFEVRVVRIIKLVEHRRRGFGAIRVFTSGIRRNFRVLFHHRWAI